MAATPNPTTNMSRPLAHTLRPVNRLRAAPIAKCASMLIASDAQTAAPWFSTKNGAIGMKAPIAVATPVTTPSLSGASSAGWMLSSSRTIASSACDGSCIIARAVSRARSGFYFQAEDGIRGATVTGVQTCALPIGLAYELDASLPPVGADEELLRQ